MDPRKQRIEAVFDQAVELKLPGERAAYLSQACGEDPQLRQEIEELLEAHERAGGFLAATLSEGAPLPLTDSRASPSEQPGCVIGRYKLLEKIGEGGCGVVYLAEQNEPVKRRVALKIIKPGMATNQVVARFEAERQALALMDHPNIAKIYDAGVIESTLTGPSNTLSPTGAEGQGEGAAHLAASAKSHVEDQKSHIHQGGPYFVMELVRGIKITDYCDEKSLSTGKRLDLFIQVCQAVQHAHQKGIIHRDLKPSNILVTVNDGKAVPKVIDFGIAKATQAELTGKTLFTRFHQFLGTPAYMSPEQAEMTSLDIDTRSDIYSLGVLLYELLTGKTPFDAEELLKASLDEMRRTIREVEPIKPSTRLTQELTTASARRSAKGRKGEKERRGVKPAERSGSPSPPFPSAPFPPRQSAELSEDNQISLPRFHQLKELIPLLRGDLDWIVMKCLEKDRNRRYETANGLAADIKRHLDNEPIVARPPSTAYRFEKLICRNKLAFGAAGAVALTLLAGIVVSSWQAVRARRAEQQAKEQAAIAKQQAERAKAVQDFLAENLLGVNVLAGTTPDPDATSFETTRAMVEKATRKLERKFINQPLTEAELRITLSWAFAGFGDSANLAVQAERALQIRQAVLGPGHSDTLEAVAMLAHGKYQMGRATEARKLLQDAMVVARSAPNGLSVGGACVVYSYGDFLVYGGHGPEALPYLREGLAGLKRTLDPKHLWIKHVMGTIAYATEGTGRFQEAEAMWRECIRQGKSDLGPDHQYTLAPQFGLARFLVGQGRSREALPLLERYIAFNEQKIGTNDHMTLDALSWLGKAYEQLGRIEDAGKVYTDLYPRWLKQLPYIPGARTLCPEIARFFVRQRRYEDAKAIYGPLREFFEANPPEESSDFETLIQATAATKGWRAVAEIWRENFDRSADLLSVWLNKAWVFRYVGDEQQYRQVVTNVLALAKRTNTRDHAPLEIAALGTFDFSSEQLAQLQALTKLLESGLPQRPADQQGWGYRAIAQFQFRRQNYNESLAALENSISKHANPDSYTLFIKAACLHRLGESAQARTLFDDAVSLSNSQLPQPIAESENFLTPAQLYQHLAMRRETQAVLTGSQTKP